VVSYPPYLFSVYIDDLITDLRQSGYGVYIGSSFAGCILQGGPKKSKPLSRIIIKSY